MSYSITITFDTLGQAAEWFKSQGQNVGSNVTVTNNTQTAPASSQSNAQTSESDPWTDDAPTRPATNQTSSEPERYCAHGKMRYFPNGQYGPFFACSLDKNDPNKCKTQKG